MKTNQKGFGTTEAILAVIIIILIGVVGFMVYKNHNKSDSLNSSSASEQVSKADTLNADKNKLKSTKLMEINDLGIQIKLNPTLADLVYEANGDQEPITVTFDSKSFTDLVAKCRNDEGQNINLGTASRYDGTFDENNPPSFYDDFIKQFNGFFITYGSADGGFCNNGNQAAEAAVEKKYTEFKSNIVAALKAATPVKNINSN